MTNGGTPTTYNEFSTSNLKLSQIKTTPRGAKVVWVNYNTGPVSGPLYLQTPFGLRAPMGITKWENEGQNPSFELLLSLSGEQGSEFADKLGEFDEFVKNEALSKSKEWFKKNIDNMVVIETLYNPSLRQPRDKETGEITQKYPPSFRAKIPMSPDGKPECEVYEMVNGNAVSVDLLDLMEKKSLKGASITAIVKCSGIWFPQKFSASWQVQQLLIEPNSGVLKPFAFTGICKSPANTGIQDVAEEGYFNNYQDVDFVEDNIE